MQKRFQVIQKLQTPYDDDEYRIVASYSSEYEAKHDAETLNTQMERLQVYFGPDDHFYSYFVQEK
jgi:hypothetical protein